MSIRNLALLGTTLATLALGACSTNVGSGTGGSAAGGTVVAPPCQDYSNVLQACCNTLTGDFKAQCEAAATAALRGNPTACTLAAQSFKCATGGTGGTGTGGFGGTGGTGGSCGDTGAFCSTDSDCCFDPCVSNQCGGSTGCGDTGAFCSTDSDCCSDPCVSNQCGGSTGCGNTGAFCNTDADCCSDPCVSNQCGGTSDPCADGSDCTQCADFNTCASCEQGNHPSGAQLFNDLVDCVYCTGCYTVCDGASAGCPSAPSTKDTCDVGAAGDATACSDQTVSPATGCIPCVEAGTCKSAYTACSGAQDCIAFNDALQNCPQN